MSDDKALPVYDEPATTPTESAMARLNKLVKKQAAIQLKKLELESELSVVSKELEAYQSKLIPELMTEIGLKKIETATGLIVEVVETLQGQFPKDPEKREAAFEYLRETGNDGLILREISVKYGRDATEHADRLMAMLRDAGVDQYGSLERRETLNHQSMLAFLRGELREGTIDQETLRKFGVFQQITTKLKLPSGGEL